MVIVVAGTLTVLLGLKNVWEYDVSRIAFVLSAAVTAATTWDAFADHHWIRYRAVLHQLFALRDELKYRMVGEVLPTQAEFDEFFERLQATVKELDEEWTAQRLKLMKDKAKTDVISSGKLSGA